MIIKRTVFGAMAWICGVDGFKSEWCADLRNLDTDDVLDACAALWTAGRIFLGTAMRIPEIIERDARGLDMAMWF